MCVFLYKYNLNMHSTHIYVKNLNRLINLTALFHIKIFVAVIIINLLYSENLYLKIHISSYYYHHY